LADPLRQVNAELVAVEAIRQKSGDAPSKKAEFLVGVRQYQRIGPEEKLRKAIDD